MDDKERKRQAKVFNERAKMFAGTVNALAIATLGAALVLPLIRDGDLSVLTRFSTWAWLGLGTTLHLAALAVLGMIRSEE